MGTLFRLSMSQQKKRFSTAETLGLAAGLSGLAGLAGYVGGAKVVQGKGSESAQLADEIQRLRGENETLRAAAAAQEARQATKDSTELNAANEQVRALAARASRLELARQGLEAELKARDAKIAQLSEDNASIVRFSGQEMEAARTRFARETNALLGRVTRLESALAESQRRRWRLINALVALIAFGRQQLLQAMRVAKDELVSEFLRVRDHDSTSSGHSQQIVKETETSLRSVADAHASSREALERAARQVRWLLENSKTPLTTRPSEALSGSLVELLTGKAAKAEPEPKTRANTEPPARPSVPFTGEQLQQQLNKLKDSRHEAEAPTQASPWQALLNGIRQAVAPSPTPGPSPAPDEWSLPPPSPPPLEEED